MNRRTFCGALAGALHAAPRAYLQVRGDARAGEILNRAFAILAGRPDNHTLGKLVVTGVDGQQHFINDNVWWLWTDSQCNYHATYGWRPFLDAAYRRIDKTTWTTPFRNQVTREMQDRFRSEQKAPKVPPLGWLPGSYDPLKKQRVVSDSVTQYYCNAYLKKNSVETSIGMDHGENSDYPLQNLISALDWCLWERDTAVAREYLPKIDAFLEAVRTHEQANGLTLTFTQASQIEYGHNGWRFPGHTHVYLLAVYRRLVEVATMTGQADLLRKYAARNEALSDRIRLLLEQDKWFVGGLQLDAREKLGSGRLDGSPSDYFDVWHNVNAAVLGVADGALSRSIVSKLRSIPALTENHLTLVNYPARPTAEMDTVDWYPKAGQHVNAGFMWMTGGSALGAHALTGHAATLDEAAGLLDDFDKHLTIDYYNNYGRDKESQWHERGRDSYSVTSAGAFGMLFRGILDFRPTATSLTLRPRLPHGVESLRIDWPVRYGEKELRFEIRRGASEVRIDGKPAKRAIGNGRFELAYERLPSRAEIVVRQGEEG